MADELSLVTPKLNFLSTSTMSSVMSPKLMFLIVIYLRSAVGLARVPIYTVYNIFDDYNIIHCRVQDADLSLHDNLTVVDAFRDVSD